MFLEKNYIDAILLTTELVQYVSGRWNEWDLFSKCIAMKLATWHNLCQGFLGPTFVSGIFWADFKIVSMILASISSCAVCRTSCRACLQNRLN